eukprot:210978-Chlamydomonas_euryale.AAC.1
MRTGRLVAAQPLKELEGARCLAHACTFSGHVAMLAHCHCNNKKFGRIWAWTFVRLCNHPIGKCQQKWERLTNRRFTYVCRSACRAAGNTYSAHREVCGRHVPLSGVQSLHTRSAIALCGPDKHTLLLYLGCDPGSLLRVNCVAVGGPVAAAGLRPTCGMTRTP